MGGKGGKSCKRDRVLGCGPHNGGGTLHTASPSLGTLKEAQENPELPTPQADSKTDLSTGTHVGMSEVGAVQLG